MQRKSMLLFGLLASLLSVGQAWSAPEVGYYHGSEFSVASADGNFKLGIGGLLQEDNRITYDKRDTAVKGEKTKIGMKIDNARLHIRGNAFDPAFTYLFQAQFDKENGTNSPKGYPRLLDYYGNMGLHSKWAQFRFGKFTTPYSRQQITSPASGQFGFLSSANDSDILPQGRDVGLMLHNGSREDFEYALAVVTNGLAARLGYNHGNIDGYNATDFTGGGFRFGIAGSGFLQTSYVSSKFDHLNLAGDLIVKYHGFATNGVVYYKRQLEGADKNKNSVAASIDLGYLINSKCEPVARYSWKPAGTRANRIHGHEITLGLNHYIFGNHLRAHAYVGTNLTNSKIDEFLGGVQLQLAL